MPLIPISQDSTVLHMVVTVGSPPPFLGPWTQDQEEISQLEHTYYS